MDWKFTLIIALMTFVIMMLFLVIFTFIDAKREIAKYNEKAIEACYILECDITILGDMSCKTTYAPASMNITDSYFIKIDGGLNETAGI